MQLKFDQASNSSFLKHDKIAIIVAYFYKSIGENLLTAAKDTLKKYGINEDNIDVFYLPGAFEVPLMAQQLAKSKRYNGIITLGAVIRGETPHFDFICSQCANGISKVSTDYNIPVAFGILTTNNHKQAESRSGGDKGNKGFEAAMAMIEMLYLLRQLPH